jgi:predicted ATP-grasp superfamily ATP-dependent carboligase
LNAARENILKKFGDFIIQEFIPGASTMRSVQLLFNKENKVIGNFILKKIHQWPVSGGITAYAVSTHEWELISFVLPFLRKCHWEGPVEIELIIDERDRKPKLIEINPRFPGTISFPVQCGVNFPYLTCMAAINKDYSIDPPCYNAGSIYINFSYYLKSIIKEFYLSNNKAAFLYNTFKELRSKKVSTIPDKKDIIMFIAKSWAEIAAL